MARLPNVRENYHDDARFCLRLISAIERDEARPQAWRDDMIADLNEMAQKFMNAPSPLKMKKGA